MRLPGKLNEHQVTNGVRGQMLQLVFSINQEDGKCEESMVRWRSSPAAPAASGRGSARGSGLGAAICRRFGGEGASVAVFDINQDAAEAVAGTIRESGGTARAYAVDLTSQESVVAAVAGVEGELGPIDIMVNNAGWHRAGAFLDTDKELWDRIVAVNLYGPLYM